MIFFWKGTIVRLCDFRCVALYFLKPQTPKGAFEVNPNKYGYFYHHQTENQYVPQYNDAMKYLSRYQTGIISNGRFIGMGGCRCEPCARRPKQSYPTHQPDCAGDCFVPRNDG